VESAVNQGTTFDILLPCRNDSAIRKSEAIETSLLGSEHILIVDDEPVIVSMYAKSLEKRGYKIYSCTNPHEALDRLQKTPDQFDLVVTDYSMPKLTGIELAQKMLTVRNDLPIILCTGFSEQVDPESLFKAGIRELIKKPVLQRELAQTIRTVLNKNTIS